MSKSDKQLLFVLPFSKQNVIDLYISKKLKANNKDIYEHG